MRKITIFYLLLFLVNACTPQKEIQTTTPPANPNTGIVNSDTTSNDEPADNPSDDPISTTQPTESNTDSTTTATEVVEPTEPAYKMPELEEAMLAEINLLRANPPAYIPLVREYIAAVEQEPAFDLAYKRAEKAAADELIEELAKLDSLPVLSADEGLYYAAAHHGEDVKKMGRPTHTGRDGSQPFERIKKYSPEMEDGAENIVMGANDVREALMLLLVDSGIPGRGHRVNLLKPSWNYNACYHIGEVDGLAGSWVQVFGEKPGPATETTEPVEEGPADFSFMFYEERQMIEEINLMRGNPSGYIPYVRTYLQEYKNSGWDDAAEEERIVNELIGELMSTPPLSFLRPHKGLYDVAKVHGQDLKQMGMIVHIGSDGSNPYSRIRQGTDLTNGNENIVGGNTYVRESVINLLVDSGIPNRGHRKTLMNPEWQYVACHKVGQVGPFPNTWLQVFGAK